jgi:hypothetical protein
VLGQIVDLDLDVGVKSTREPGCSGDGVVGVI